jgi:hypothetical protein
MNDTALTSSRRLADLLLRKHGCMADFLVALAAFDREGTYRALGFANVFDYLQRELGLSRGSAHYRKVAARLVAKFPEVVEPLRDGRLCITSILALAKAMTGENRAEVLPMFFHRSKQEAKELLAELRPAAVVPRREVVTREPVTERIAPAKVQPVERPDVGRLATAPRTVAVEPLTADLRRLHLTVSREFLELLEKAKAGESHVNPVASAEHVLLAGLRLLVERQEK